MELDEFGLAYKARAEWTGHDRGSDVAGDVTPPPFLQLETSDWNWTLCGGLPGALSEG